MIPYGRQSIDTSDIKAADTVLASDWLTQGPKVEEFEKKLAAYCGARFAVVTANGTAALIAAYRAAGLAAGDEFITTPLTFPATANAGVWLGARPVFVDVEPETGNIDASQIESAITPKTKLIAPVDFTGRPCDLELIRDIATRQKLAVVEDACQALGASYKGQKIGSISDCTVFSFHPVKSITTGEGGAILTNSEEKYKRMKAFVSHGVVKENFVNESHGDWYFEMQDLGLNFRLTDFQCALGISQLSRIKKLLERRREIADRYRVALASLTSIALPPEDDAVRTSAWHLFVIRLQGALVQRKAAIFHELRQQGIGVQVHHIPTHLHPYYAKLGYRKGALPKAERFYEAALSLPMYPDLTEQDQKQVVDTVKKVLI
ncbi:MAG: UDP-4-amino-4,6-dideoxy-N-acetyl-beta-L-altrosamine transaminase [Candidatus Komeilibacteria bacterium RIFCSPLOWO2_01_FULL_52_15]|uniref:UDP-4-amino-4, 6-dideoxy-N-acetyl-beta-L-altrosamine transaminase n=2 Tax=Candidatus Komeiliibacteriota TaxID=1817908 RepID=A0A1G2BRW6_9BACT|nr:MAG: UDP-4-amino-4,6-dideoxy-N-acetyl-beta-L-altrosamine transaminase [Candidatus Komeilibacteria bacterium RIFCSPHIGHO2_01_FULL_52_14]OGY91130.1 MAG: UDP-4-amino-4,6-dideoxy-N-acetyl-beta-L-altrosamine transaminase [Candidatus Komeilibacteria bacterium RIFCSPLOWO2_01_FULL_52_15]